MNMQRMSAVISLENAVNGIAGIQGCKGYLSTVSQVALEDSRQGCFYLSEEFLQRIQFFSDTFWICFELTNFFSLCLCLTKQIFH